MESNNLATFKTPQLGQIQSLMLMNDTKNDGMKKLCLKKRWTELTINERKDGWIN